MQNRNTKVEPLQSSGNSTKPLVSGSAVPQFAIVKVKDGKESYGNTHVCRCNKCKSRLAKCDWGNGKGYDYAMRIFTNAALEHQKHCH